MYKFEPFYRFCWIFVLLICLIPGPYFHYKTGAIASASAPLEACYFVSLVCYAYLLIRLVIYRNYIVIDGDKLVIRNPWYSSSIVLSAINNISINNKNGNPEILWFDIYTGNKKRIRVSRFTVRDKDFFLLLDLLLLLTSKK